MTRPAGQSDALWVLKRLREAGHEALFAGGCVRDRLLKRPCTDYDVATDATPQQVRKLFRQVLLVGAKFGVAMVIHKGRKVEVATFRSDLSYSDGRRPDGVTFSTAREDAQRRDFTINGMFYDPIANDVIDYVDGQADLAAGVIRTIGDPQQRFDEDYLRMVRAPRFAVRLGFRIDKATAAAIRKNAEKIVDISGERIFDELCKMLSLPSAPEALNLLHDLKLTRPLLPAMFEKPDRWPSAVNRVAALAKYKDLTLTLAALLADLPEKTLRRIVRAWGAPNELRDAICFIAKHRAAWSDAAERPLCDFKRLMANRNFQRLQRLWTAEEKAATGRTTCARRIARRVRSIPLDAIAPAPLVTGDDLKQKLKLSEGPQLGKILRTVYDAQLNEEIATMGEAVALAKKLKNQD